MPSKYLLYLLGQVLRHAPGHYERLLGQLYKIDFYDLVPHDDNRAADGLQLRQEFMEMEGATSPLPFAEKPCSMLEMLIGLSRRLEIEMFGSRWDQDAGAWFWVLIRNLGLDVFTDQTYVQRSTPKFVAEICDTFLERHYNYDGKGGLFPLKKPQKDQKMVEIWYQMSAFIMENFPF